MGLWNGMDKRDLAYIPDLGLIGHPIPRLGTLLCVSSWSFRLVKGRTDNVRDAQ